MTNAFCGDCNRLRLMADGNLKVLLLSSFGLLIDPYSVMWCSLQILLVLLEMWFCKNSSYFIAWASLQ